MTSHYEESGFLRRDLRLRADYFANPSLEPRHNGWTPRPGSARTSAVGNRPARVFGARRHPACIASASRI